MVKPIRGSSPQPVPSETPENKLQPQTEETDKLPKKPVYDSIAQTSRRAEHSMIGTSRAAELNAQLAALQKNSSQAGSVMVPRMKWEVPVRHQESPVPTPFPNLANAGNSEDKKKTDK